MDTDTSTILVVLAEQRQEAHLRKFFDETFRQYDLSVQFSVEDAGRVLDQKKVDVAIYGGNVRDDSCSAFCQLFNKDKRYQHIPKLIISDDCNTVSFSEHLANMAPDDFVPWSVNESELATRIRFMLRIKQSQDAAFAVSQKLEAVTAEHAAKLKLSEERYQRLVEISPDMIAVCSEGMFVFVNGAAKEMLGINNVNEIIARDVIEVVEPDDREAVSKLLRECSRQDDTHMSILMKLRKADGTTVPVEAVGVPFDEKDVLLVIRDVQNRKELSERFRQSQRMEAVGQLSGGVAHDFNNILTTIKGYSDLILESLTDGDPLIDDAREINNATERAASLTRQLLAFSRRQVMAPTALDFNNVVLAIKRMLIRMIGENIELVTDLEPDLGIIKADRSQVEQVLMNLAVNARDAMPDGGKVTIRTRNCKLDENADPSLDLHLGDYVLLEVTDTGTGMSQDTAFRIFEPFFTTKGRDKGTGLGLSTVYGIVKQSGGDIILDSEMGKGTTFKIYLPVVPDLIARMAPVQTENGPRKGWETVLLVEDENAVRYLAKRLLVRAGYNVLSARHGGEALYVCEQYDGPIHVTVTDVVMPEMGGVELVQRLLEDHPHMRTILMSGYADIDVSKIEATVREVEFLQKPFSYEELTDIVRRVLDRASVIPRRSNQESVNVLNSPQE